MPVSYFGDEDLPFTHENVWFVHLILTTYAMQSFQTSTPYRHQCAVCNDTRLALSAGVTSVLEKKQKPPKVWFRHHSSHSHLLLISCSSPSHLLSSKAEHLMLSWRSNTNRYLGNAMPTRTGVHRVNIFAIGERCLMFQINKMHCSKRIKPLWMMLSIFYQQAMEHYARSPGARFCWYCSGSEQYLANPGGRQATELADKPGRHHQIKGVLREAVFSVWTFFSCGIPQGGCAIRMICFEITIIHINEKTYVTKNSFLPCQIIWFLRCCICYL